MSTTIDNSISNDVSPVQTQESMPEPRTSEAATTAQVDATMLPRLIRLINGEASKPDQGLIPNQSVHLTNSELDCEIETIVTYHHGENLIDIGRLTATCVNEGQYQLDNVFLTGAIDMEGESQEPPFTRVSDNEFTTLKRL